MSDDNSNLPAERSGKPVDIVRGALERMKPQLAMALPKHLTPERLVRIAMTAVQRTPKLLDCDRTSFYAAIMTAAQLGLEPDGVLGQAYLIPFGGKVQFIPGYKGLLTLARNSGEISYIAAHEVRDNDQFDFDFASGDPPVHKFSLKEDRGDVIAFYAIAKFRDGSFHWDMMTQAEVELIRDNSSGYQAAKRYAKAGNIDSPWVSNPVEMGKKTVIRRLAKYLPLSVQKAAEIDAQVNAGMHVSLDRYGDVVIEGESTPVAEANDAPAATSKLDRFDERHGIVPRGTNEPDGPPTIENTELRSSDAAERPDRDERAPPSQPAHPGESSPVARETPPQTLSPATSPQPERKVTVSADHAPSGSLSSASADATIPVAGDLPLSTPRDIRFWGRKDGSLRLLAAAPDAFMLELPIRLAECRDWDETENIERANRGLIGKLSTEDRIEMSGMFARRREELRGA